MVVQTPPLPSTPGSEIGAGVIEDARARQRRHRRLGGVLIAAAVAIGVLMAGFGSGGRGSGVGALGNGHSPGSGPGVRPAHAAANRLFTGAPSTQANGYGVTDDACPLAAPDRYLPARSGCVTVRRADVNADGRPDLIIVYSRLSRQHPSGYVGGTPPSLRHDFVAEAAFLKVVLSNGTSVSTRITGTRETGAAAIDAVAHVNDDPGKEIFLEVERISSGATVVAYGFHNARLIPAGVMLEYGGDSASKTDFDCLPGNPPHLIQRAYELIGPTIYGWWRETSVTYAWHGPKLAQITRRTFKRRGAVTISNMGIGQGCIAGIK
jgi:hypothetical protein